MSTIVTSILGLYRSAGGDYSAEILGQHRNTGIALTVVAALTLVLHSALLRGGVGWLRWYRGALGATLMLLLVASHHGGSLTHGEGFLTHNAPKPIRGRIDRWNSILLLYTPDADQHLTLEYVGSCTTLTHKEIT